MAKNDPQSKKKTTFMERMFGSKEGNAIASAEYKRDMGINPKAKKISNAEASRSYRSMDNPTSGRQKLTAEQRVSMDDMARKKGAKVVPTSAPPSKDEYSSPAPKRLRVTGGWGAAAIPSDSKMRVRAGNGGNKRGGFDTKVDEKYYYGSNAKQDKKPSPPKPKPKDAGAMMKAQRQGQNPLNKASKADPTASQGKKANKPTKYPGFKGNWKNAAPMSVQEPKTAQQAARRADGGASFAQKKLGSKLRSMK